MQTTNRLIHKISHPYWDEIVFLLILSEKDYIWIDESECVYYIIYDLTGEVLRHTITACVLINVCTFKVPHRASFTESKDRMQCKRYTSPEFLELWSSKFDLDKSRANWKWDNKKIKTTVICSNALFEKNIILLLDIQSLVFAVQKKCETTSLLLARRWMEIFYYFKIFGDEMKEIITPTAVQPSTNESFLILVPAVAVFLMDQMTTSAKLLAVKLLLACPAGNGQSMLLSLQHAEETQPLTIFLPCFWHTSHCEWTISVASGNWPQVLTILSNAYNFIF